MIYKIDEHFDFQKFKSALALEGCDVSKYNSIKDYFIFCDEHFNFRINDKGIFLNNHNNFCYFTITSKSFNHMYGTLQVDFSSIATQIEKTMEKLSKGKDLKSAATFKQQLFIPFIHNKISNANGTLIGIAEHNRYTVVSFKIENTTFEIRTTITDLIRYIDTDFDNLKSNICMTVSNVNAIIKNTSIKEFFDNVYSFLQNIKTNISKNEELKKTFFYKDTEMSQTIKRLQFDRDKIRTDIDALKNNTAKLLKDSIINTFERSDEN